jgi:hypothetical protein
LLSIISFSLVISLFGGHHFLLNPASYSNNIANAQSPADITLPTNNTETTSVSNATGVNATNIEQTLNFAAVGDISCRPESNKTVSNMVSKNPEVVLALGDFSYDNSSKCWIDLMKPFENKTKISLGNHEWPFQLMMEYVNHYNLTRPYYAFNIDNVHFLALSNEFAFDEKSAQYDYAMDDLRAAAVDPAMDWKVVFFHKPMHTSHQSESNTEFRDAYHPLFDEFGVDLVLQGHAHYYERSFPIEYNPESRREPIPSNATLGNNTFVDPRGPIVATVGTGGASIHDLESGKANFVQKQYLGYGILDVNIENNQTMTVLNGTYHNNDGQVIDQFNILKPSIYALTTQESMHEIIEPNYARYDVTDTVD